MKATGTPEGHGAPQVTDRSALPPSSPRRFSLGHHRDAGAAGSESHVSNLELKHSRHVQAALGEDGPRRIGPRRCVSTTCVTHAALLIAQGAHPKAIQARLGHASITTTLNTYGHLWPALGAQLDDKMDQAFRQARSNVACGWPGPSGTVLPMPSQQTGDESGNRS